VHREGAGRTYKAYKYATADSSITEMLKAQQKYFYILKYST